MGRGGEKAPAGSRVISAQELSKHNKPGDAWLAIRGKVRSELHLERCEVWRVRLTYSFALVLTMRFLASIMPCRYTMYQRGQITLVAV